MLLPDRDYLVLIPFIACPIAVCLGILQVLPEMQRRRLADTHASRRLWPTDLHRKNSHRTALFRRGNDHPMFSLGLGLCARGTSRHSLALDNDTSHCFTSIAMFHVLPRGRSSFDWPQHSERDCCHSHLRPFCVFITYIDVQYSGDMASPPTVGLTFFVGVAMLVAAAGGFCTCAVKTANSSTWSRRSSVCESCFGDGLCSDGRNDR